MLVLIKGAGDLDTGTAVRLYRAGIKVVMTEVAQPTAGGGRRGGPPGAGAG